MGEAEEGVMGEKRVRTCEECRHWVETKQGPACAKDDVYHYAPPGRQACAEFEEREAQRKGAKMSEPRTLYEDPATGAIRGVVCGTCAKYNPATRLCVEGAGERPPNMTSCGDCWEMGATEDVGLRPCPFCGSNPNETPHESAELELHVKCLECGAEGPHVDKKLLSDLAEAEEARRQWNERAEGMYPPSGGSLVQPPEQDGLSLAHRHPDLERRLRVLEAEINVRRTAREA